MNLTIMNVARSILFYSQLHKSFWGNAIETAVYLINRVPTRTNENNKTPYELWHNRKTAIKYLRVFGSTAYVHKKLTNGKLDSRSTKGIFVGYEPSGYKVYIPSDRKFILSKDVQFDEVSFMETRPNQSSGIERYSANDYCNDDHAEMDQCAGTGPNSCNDLFDRSDINGGGNQNAEKCGTSMPESHSDNPLSRRHRVNCNASLSRNELFDRSDTYGGGYQTVPECQEAMSGNPLASRHGRYSDEPVSCNDLFDRSESNGGGYQEADKAVQDSQHASDNPLFHRHENRGDYQEANTAVTESLKRNLGQGHARSRLSKDDRMTVSQSYDSYDEDDESPSKNLLGCLMYIMICTRPDICLAVNICSRYVSNNNKEVWGHLKRILRYLKETMNLKLSYEILTKRTRWFLFFVVDQVIATGDANLIKDLNNNFLREIKYHRQELIEGYCTISWKQS